MLSNYEEEKKNSPRAQTRRVPHILTWGGRGDGRGEGRGLGRGRGRGRVAVVVGRGGLWWS